MTGTYRLYRLDHAGIKQYMRRIYFGGNAKQRRTQRREYLSRRNFRDDILEMV